MHIVSSRRIATATLLGVLVFVSKALIPTPFDKMVIAPQALLLTLGFLLIGVPGATYVAFVGGVLSAAWRSSFAPFTFGFALAYGLLTDAFCYAMHVRSHEGSVKKRRLVAAVTISTMIVGLSSYYVTVVLLGMLPRNLLLEVIILVAGTLNGLVAGLAVLLVWSRIAGRQS